jgi:CheY-like chemotaxis protein
MQKKILVVEDNSDCRELVVIQLKRMGYHVIEAATGEEGIRKALAELPDLIIMDLGLPMISGIEATIELKEEPTTARIPVVAFTAWEEETYKRRAKAAGIETFLTKPTSFGVFRQVVQRILSANAPNQLPIDRKAENLRRVLIGSTNG